MKRDPLFETAQSPIMPAFDASRHAVARSLYIHIPYCVRKCPYCDFYKVARPDANAVSSAVPAGSAFLRALRAEAEQRAFLCPAPRTIFVGGGTPSALTLAEWDELLKILRECFDLSAVEEWTVECNPNSLNVEKAAIMAAGGVNRLSIGVQSFDARALAFLGRAHTADDVPVAFAAARQAGIDNLSLDLIAGLGPSAGVEEPARTLADVQTALDPSSGIGPLSHVSVYSLIVEEGTPFFARAEKGEAIGSDEDTAATAYEAVADALAAADFEHYEISNFSRDAHTRCAHNMAYWQCDPYLGLGPSAHSFDGRRRWGNRRDLAAYTRALDPQSTATPTTADSVPTADSGVGFWEILTPDQLFIEHLLMGLRVADGVDVARAAARAGAVAEEIGASPATVAGWGALAAHAPRLTVDLAERGVVRWSDDGRLGLTPAGFLLCDRIIIELVQRFDLAAIKI